MISSVSRGLKSRVIRSYPSGRWIASTWGYMHIPVSSPPVLLPRTRVLIMSSISFLGVQACRLPWSGRIALVRQSSNYTCGMLSMYLRTSDVSDWLAFIEIRLTVSFQPLIGPVGHQRELRPDQPSLYR